MDPDNRVYRVVEARLYVARTLAREAGMPSPEFSIRLESWLKNLRSIAPWQADALHALALIRASENRWAEAVDFLREAVKFKSEHLEMRADFCRALMHLGEAGREEAEFEARAALSDQSRQGQVEPEWALRWLTLVLDAKGDLPGMAEAAWRAAHKNPYWGEAWRVLSVACQDTDPDAALSHAEKAAELSPDSFPCVFHLCCLLRLRGKYDKATATAKASLAYWPERVRLHMFISEILEKQGNMEAAAERAFKAVEAEPIAAEIRIFLASLLIRCGRLDEAETVARDGMERFPGEGWPHVVYAQIIEAQGDIAGALAEAGLACRKQPHKRSVAVNYARLLRVNGRLDECESFCRKALSEDSRQGWAWRELCRCAVACEDAKAALEYGSKAIAVHPEDTEFRQYVANLKTAQ
jgi:tetratricopeptide (TPR) repeat protein